jgi:hypothetical protein
VAMKWRILYLIETNDGNTDKIVRGKFFGFLFTLL